MVTFTNDFLVFDACNVNSNKVLRAGNNFKTSKNWTSTRLSCEDDKDLSIRKFFDKARKATTSGDQLKLYDASGNLYATLPKFN